MSPKAAGLLLAVERLRAAVHAQHWQTSVNACEQLCCLLEEMASQPLSDALRETSQQAVATLRVVHVAVTQELLRLPQEIARLEHYRAAMSAYAHHGLPLDQTP